jgi:hypothetical protein
MKRYLATRLPGSAPLISRTLSALSLTPRLQPGETRPELTPNRFNGFPLRIKAGYWLLAIVYWLSSHHSHYSHSPPRPHETLADKTSGELLPNRERWHAVARKAGVF